MATKDHLTAEWEQIWSVTCFSNTYVCRSIFFPQPVTRIISLQTVLYQQLEPWHKTTFVTRIFL